MRTSRFIRGGSSLLALVLAVAVPSACDDNPILGPGEFQGTWSLTDSSGTVVLVITSDSIHEYDQDPIADCYEHVAYEIIGIDGREFELGMIGDTIVVELHRDDEHLVAVIGNREVRYVDSSIDPATLPLCPPPGVTVSCGEQEPLAIDSTAEGTIEGSDEVNPNGTHYDLYRVDVAASTALQFDMSSSFDSYLLLFDSLGTFVTRNDDASNLTLDARIRHTLDPGCWILMATTAFADRFGDYELSAEVD